MKRFCVFLSTLILALSLIFGISGNGFAAQYTIKLHYEMPTTAPLAKYGFEPWAKDLEKATNGKVKVQTYPGDTLFKTKTDAVEAIKAGIADIAFMFAWAFSPQFDLTDVLSVPFIAPNAEVASRATWEVFQKFPELQQQWKDVKLLAVWTTDPYIFITTKKQIKTMEDFKGMKMRMTGGAATEMMKLLGGVPMTIPMPQNYENLQKGVIDGMASPAEAILGFRFYEVVKYYTMCPSTLVTQEMIMNWNSWKRLPKDIQDAIMSLCGDNAAIRFGGGCFDRAWSILPDIVKKANRPMISYTPPQQEKDRWIKQAGKPLWEEWIKKMESRGYQNARAIQEEAIHMVEKFSAGKTDNWKEMFPFSE